jgi:sec-independent protein translocase protein TatA
MLAFFNMGPPEWIVILIVALLLFGRRLPEVMRNLGKGIVEFKRGVRGIEDQIDDESSHAPPTPPRQPAAVNPAPPQAADSEATPSESPSEKAAE